MGVSNPQDDPAESLGSAQHGRPSGWKSPSATEPISDSYSVTL